MSGSPIQEACCCLCRLSSREKLICFDDVFITMRYDTEYLPDAEKLTDRQLSLPHGNNRNNKENQAVGLLRQMLTQFHNLPLRLTVKKVENSFTVSLNTKFVIKTTGSPLHLRDINL